jgi:hypothetical protein
VTQTETVAPASADDTREESDVEEHQTQSFVPPSPPAHLTVLVYPWGSVWINGKPRGPAPLKNEPLKPGRYKISAGQDGPSQTRTVPLRQGDRKTIRFDLTD